MIHNSIPMEYYHTVKLHSIDVNPNKMLLINVSIYSFETVTVINNLINYLPHKL